MRSFVRSAFIARGGPDSAVRDIVGPPSVAQGQIGTGAADGCCTPLTRQVG